VTLLLFLYVTEEAGRKYVRDMPWPLAAECNMITNKQTAISLQSHANLTLISRHLAKIARQRSVKACCQSFNLNDIQMYCKEAGNDFTYARLTNPSRIYSVQAFGVAMKAPLNKYLLVVITAKVYFKSAHAVVTPKACTEYNLCSIGSSHSSRFTNSLRSFRTGLLC